MSTVWLMTEEAPKTSTIADVLKQYSSRNGIHADITPENVRIDPI